nr:ATP synthase subunit epsilon, mitochondrial [Ipomoea batatas]
MVICLPLLLISNHRAKGNEFKRSVLLKPLSGGVVDCGRLGFDIEACSVELTNLPSDRYVFPGLRYVSESSNRKKMASNAAVPFWRAAGMTYITYSNLCANMVRNCLKDPYKSEALSREKVHFSVSKWIDGKAEKPGKHSFYASCIDSQHRFQF